MSIMEESKLSGLIFKNLIEEYAYSLALYEEQGDKCLYLEYKNIYNVNSLREKCSEIGVEMNERALSMKVSEVRRENRSPRCALMEMHGVAGNENFFIGEILRLNLKNGEYVDIAKIDKDRWWVTDATGDFCNLCASYVRLENSIGAAAILNCGTVSLEIESVYFLVSTDCFRRFDTVLFPSYYFIGTPEGFSLEETLIVPLYNEMRKTGLTDKMEFGTWRKIAEKAYENGMDSKTVWYLSNAVFRNYKRMYLWN